MDLPHLRDIRKRAILSQEELATKSGVARDTISKLETGRRKAYPSTIRKLAGGLEIAPQMLMGGVEYLDETSSSKQGRSGPGGMLMGGVEYFDEDSTQTGDERDTKAGF